MTGPIPLRFGGRALTYGVLRIVADGENSDTVPWEPAVFLKGIWPYENREFGPNSCRQLSDRRFQPIVSKYFINAPLCLGQIIRVFDRDHYSSFFRRIWCLNIIWVCIYPCTFEKLNDFASISDITLTICRNYYIW